MPQVRPETFSLGSSTGHFDVMRGFVFSTKTLGTLVLKFARRAARTKETESQLQNIDCWLIETAWTVAVLVCVKSFSCIVHQQPERDLTKKLH